MSTPAPTTGPTGISPAFKYVLVAIVTIVGVALGFIESQPVITAATIVSAIVYTLPTALSELEGA